MEDEDPPLSRGRSRSSYKDEVADEETIINIDTKQVDTEDGTPIPTLSSSSTNESDTSDRSEDSSSTPKDEDEDGNGPPMYDPNAVFDNDNIPDSADNFEGRNDEDDNEDDDDDEEEDDDDDEQLPRTRARSKSVFDPYGALENEKGVVLINPSVIEGIATKAAAEAAAATSPISSSGESPLIKQLSENRKGPLQMREVEALRKVSRVVYTTNNHF